jgi:UDP-GlcNAc:undecaprenyl-phosphate GlcNAc-1-phosphate transferase
MLEATLRSFGPPFLLAVIFTPLVRMVAMRHQWVAHPTAERWHKKSTALMGGIAIYLAMALPTYFFADFSTIWDFLSKSNQNARPISLAATIFIGATFLFLLGLFDDFRNIKPHSKLIGQILAASLVTFLGFRLNWFHSLTLDTMATLFWIVGITNAFNLIDNMDGLCAGVGAVAGISLAALYSGLSSEAFGLSLIMCGALAGFLIYNFNPAKIFMGDCGSLVIGFSISVLALNFGQLQQANRIAAVAVPILILLVPILDTSLVTVIRILSGRKASTGGRDHTSHRLVLMGFSERKAVLMLYLIGGVSGLAGVYVSISDTLSSPAVIIPAAVAFVLMGVYLSQLRVYPEKEFSRLRDRSFTPVLVELTYKRHMVLVMLDFILVAFAYYLSYRLRFDGGDFAYYFQIFLKSLPVVIGCKITVFFIMGIYRGMWSFISTSDVSLYMRTTLVGSLVSIAAVAFIYRFKDFSKGLFIIDWVLTTGLMLGVRGSFRMFIETQKRQSLTGDKVVIYGAGRGGELLLREILNNDKLGVNPIGFIDDNALKIGKKIQGYPILGGFETLERIHAKHQLNGILLSFNDRDGCHKETYASVKAFCRQHHLALKQFRIDLSDIDTHQGD